MSRPKNYLTIANELNIKGVLDAVTPDCATGWAINLDNHSEAVELELHVNGEVALTSICNLPRPDVRDAGFPTAICGFRFEISGISAFFDSPKISVKVKGANHELEGSPRQLVTLEPSREAIATGALVEQACPTAGNSFSGFPAARATSLATLIENAKAHKAAGGEIVIFPPLVDWNIPLFQRPQHMANWLAKKGALVIYGSGAWKFDSADGHFQLDDRLYWTNKLDDLMSQLPTSWISVYSTNFHYTIENINEWRQRGHKVMYEYIDHIDPKISGSYAAKLSELYTSCHQENIDLFVASANALYDDIFERFGSEKLALIPNGVDVEFYEQNRARTLEGIQDNFMPIIEHAKNGKPIVGYFGAIAPWIDYNLIRELANLLPDTQFVYVGPPYDLRAELPTAPNIHWIGKIDYHRLPVHAAWFDVCFIPFEAGEIAKTTSPLKLFEYFALQKPVVVTSGMLECIQYPEVFHGSTAAEVARAIQASLSTCKNEVFKARLQQLAVQNSWETRAVDTLDAMRMTSEAVPQGTIQQVRFDHESFGVMAFNVDRPNRHCGANLIFDHKNNKLQMRFSQEDFYSGDILSLKLKTDCAPGVKQKIRLNFTGKKLDNAIGVASIEVFINNKLAKIMDYSHLAYGEFIDLITDEEVNIELRVRVKQFMEASWHPSQSYQISINAFTKSPLVSDEVGSIFFSNPLGMVNPLIKAKLKQLISNTVSLEEVRQVG